MDPRMRPNTARWGQEGRCLVFCGCIWTRGLVLPLFILSPPRTNNVSKVKKLSDTAFVLKLSPKTTTSPCHRKRKKLHYPLHHHQKKRLLKHPFVRNAFPLASPGQFNGQPVGGRTPEESHMRGQDRAFSPMPFGMTPSPVKVGGGRVGGRKLIEGGAGEDSNFLWVLFRHAFASVRECRPPVHHSPCISDPLR